MRIRWPARRTLPSRIDFTPNSWAIARTLRFFPLNVKDEVREATLSCGSLVNRLINSSEIPSLKNSFSGSIVGLDTALCRSKGRAAEDADEDTDRERDLGGREGEG